VLYKSLKALGVPVEITLRGVRVDSGAMWALVATAVKKAVERGAPDKFKMRVSRVSEEGAHYYFAVKMEKEWRAAGGKLSSRQVKIAGEAVCAVADAINAIYSNMGMKRRVEVRYDKKGTLSIRLTSVDIKPLGFA